jgi:hypothetical protein
MKLFKFYHFSVHVSYTTVNLRTSFRQLLTGVIVLLLRSITY